MKTKHFNHLFFSIISGFFVVILAVLILLIAMNYTSENINITFPQYTYSEYVNRSKSQIFTQDGGGQLYEAELGAISGNGEIVENIGASDHYCVNNLTNFSSLSYTITSDENITARLIVSINYYSPYNRPISANSLFTISVNGNRLPLDNVYIESSLGTYDFKEKILGNISLQKGNNLIQLISSSPDYQIDYLVLVSPQKRNDNLATIGHNYSPFYYQKNKQIFESENSEIYNAIIRESSMASSQYYLLMSQNDDNAIFYLNSDADVSTISSLSLRTSTGSYSIIINVEVNDSSSQNYTFSLTESFSEFSLGNIKLRKGKNKIKISQVSNIFFLDYLALNCDINYTETIDTVIYEGEYLDNDVVNDINASNEHALLMIKDKDYLQNITSVSEDMTSLIVRIKNKSLLSLNQLLQISINDNSIKINDTLLIQDGDYHNYLIANINIENGKNTIIIRALTDGIYLDSLIFSNQIVDSNNALIYEAENAIIKGSKIEYNITASNNKNVGYIEIDDSIEFIIMSKQTITKKLTLCLSNVINVASDIYQFINIEVNGELIDLSEYLMIPSNGWRNFIEINLGNINLRNGINALKITCLTSSSYNLDYLKLS